MTRPPPVKWIARKLIMARPPAPGASPTARNAQPPHAGATPPVSDLAY